MDTIANEDESLLVRGVSQYGSNNRYIRIQSLAANDNYQTSQRAYMIVNGNTAILSDVPLLNDDANSSHPISTFESESVNFSQALKKVLISSGKFSLTRLAIVISNIGNGIVLAQIGKTAVEAGPFIATFQYIISGSILNGLLATGFLIGELNANIEFHKNKLKDETDQTTIAEITTTIEALQTKIGVNLKKSWVLSAGLSVPALILLFNIENILVAAGTDASVAKSTQAYFYPFAIGMLPTFWIMSDQQFSLGIKKPNIALAVGISHISFSMLIGYPLAIGNFGIPTLGVAGIAYGISTASIINIALLRLYFWCNNDFKKYRLFTLSLKEIFKDYNELIGKAFSLGSYGFVYWANLFVISLISGKLGKDTLAAEQTSFQLLVSFNLLLVGISQTTGILIADSYSKCKTYLEEGDALSATIWKQNAKKFANASIVVGTTFSGLICGMSIKYADPLTQLFAGDDASTELVMSLSRQMILINGLVLIAESIRGIVASSLNGIGHNIFSPLMSAITLLLLSLPISYISTVVYDIDSEWLFIIRDIAIALATIAIQLQWTRAVNSNDYGIENSQESYGFKNMYRFFCCLKNTVIVNEQKNIVVEDQEESIIIASNVCKTNLNKGKK